MFFNQVGAVMDEKNQIGEAVLLRQPDLMFEQRFAGNGNHRLGQVAEPFAQPRAGAAGENDELPRHDQEFSATISATARSTAWLEVSRGDQPSFVNFSTT